MASFVSKTVEHSGHVFARKCPPKRLPHDMEQNLTRRVLGTNVLPQRQILGSRAARRRVGRGSCAAHEREQNLCSGWGVRNSRPHLGHSFVTKLARGTWST